MKTFTRALFFLLLVPTIVFAQTNRRVVPYGASCSNATIGWEGMPDIGDVFNITVSGMPANTPVGLFVGFSDRKWLATGSPLPYKLTSIGARGCSLSVSPDLTFTAVANGSGIATFPIQIPNSAIYDGTMLYAQAFLPQAGANPLGITLTRALQIVIRRPIVLRDTIGPNSSYTNGKYGTASYTNMSGSTFLHTPSGGAPLSVPAVLKKVRAVGFIGSGTNIGCFNWSVRVWSSLSAAQANPVQGDIATVAFPQPSYGPSVFGTAPSGTGGSLNGITYDIGFNLLPSQIVLSPGISYHVAPVSVSSGCGHFKISETSLIPGPSDYCVGGFPLTTMTNLQCIGFGYTLSTGSNAVEIVASPLQ